MNTETFKFECPTCGQHISASPNDAGSSGNCPACHNSLVVPTPSGSSNTAPTQIPVERRKIHYLPIISVAIILAASLSAGGFYLFRNRSHPPIVPALQTTEPSALPQPAVTDDSKPIPSPAQGEVAATHPPQASDTKPIKPDDITFIIGGTDLNRKPLIGTSTKTGKVEFIGIQDGQTLKFVTQDALDEWYSWTGELKIFDEKPTLGNVYVVRNKKFVKLP